MRDTTPTPAGHSFPLLLLVGCAILLALLAECFLPSEADAAASSVVAPINTICPMMPDEKIVDEDNVVEFNGQQIGLCCGKCKRQWGKLDDAARQVKLTAVFPAAAPLPEAPASEVDETDLTVVSMAQLDSLGLCPKNGRDVASMGKSTRRIINGVDVTFCCPPCIKAYKEDYASYRDKIAPKIIAKQKPYYPTELCLVTGKKLGDDAIDHVHGNRLIRLADADAVAAFAKDTATHEERLDFIIADAERDNYPLDTCVVAGSAFVQEKKPAEVIVGNRLVKICCGGCTSKIRQEPYVIVKKINDAWAASSADDS